MEHAPRVRRSPNRTLTGDLVLQALPGVAEEQGEPYNFGLGLLVEQTSLQPLLKALHGPNDRWVVELVLVDETTKPAEVSVKLPVVVCLSFPHNLGRSHD